MEITFSIIIVIIMAYIASRKGYNPWLWILAGGIPGFIILLCMPSAAASDINEAIRRRRRIAGNTVGGLIGGGVIAVIIGFKIIA
ncbi:hypothetical protein [Desulfobacterium sp. N47]|uniref:Uncharacterized protein n=1 Tax=uncultured Desulfobacterium sp. TaxID=201089 RepID=E1YA04_9BACT|nr:unknown protein [uncultured Desulfobacterium sp.]